MRRSKTIKKQVNEVLDTITISEKMKNWFVRHLNELNDQETEDRGSIQKSLQKAYNDCQNRLDNLLKLKISPQNTNNEVLSDEEFARQSSKLNQEMQNIKEKLEDTEDRAKKWMDLSVRTFNFACYAKYHFENGNPEDKKAILSAFGSNITLKDKKLLILLPKHFEVIQKSNHRLRTLNNPIEPKNFSQDYKKTGVNTPAISCLHGWRESNPR